MPESERSDEDVIVTGYAEATEFSTLAVGEDDILSDDTGEFRTEVIIGPDDRRRIKNTTAWPWRVHGHMRMRFPNGRVYIGSGTMVNRHHVLTAGHCIYSHNDGGWATSVSFEAGRNDGETPFGTAFATRLLSIQGWTRNRRTEWDFGMLVLASDLGNQTGWKGVITGPDNLLLRHRVNVSGFPGDKSSGRQLWTHADVIKAVTSERAIYDIDTMGGQSGSGVWSTWAGHNGEKVCAVHTTGARTGNGATRISRTKFNRIVEWMSSY